MSLWNGKAGALSLTFDDGMPCQLRYAVPELDARGIRATFFLCGKNLGRDFEGWRAVAQTHEIGSHSFAHLSATRISLEVFQRDALDAKAALEKAFAMPIASYAYPYAAATPGARDAVRSLHGQGRGGHSSRGPMFISPLSPPADFAETRALNISGGNVDQIASVAEACVVLKSWITLMLHGVGPDDLEFDNVSSEQFCRMLDRVRELNLWVAPYGAVAENLRTTLNA